MLSRRQGRDIVPVVVSVVGQRRRSAVVPAAAGAAASAATAGGMALSPVAGRRRCPNVIPLAGRRHLLSGRVEASSRWHDEGVFLAVAQSLLSDGRAVIASRRRGRRPDGGAEALSRGCSGGQLSRCRQGGTSSRRQSRDVVPVAVPVARQRCHFAVVSAAGAAASVAVASGMALTIQDGNFHIHLVLLLVHTHQ